MGSKVVDPQNIISATLAPGMTHFWISPSFHTLLDWRLQGKIPVCVCVCV